MSPGCRQVLLACLFLSTLLVTSGTQHGGADGNDHEREHGDADGNGHEREHGDADGNGHEREGNGPEHGAELLLSKLIIQLSVY